MAGIFARSGRQKMQVWEVIRILTFWLVAVMMVRAGELLRIRAVAANLTSDNRQAYAPDNGNHSNPEGAGARILKGLKPDIVMIQEFNTTIPTRQWVNRTFGEDFQFAQEEGMQIPNGIVSRFPIAKSGSWDDPVLENREFLWAEIRLPGRASLWVVSLHLHSKTEASRNLQATALVKFIKLNVPAGAMLLVGGDLNTRTEGEACFRQLAEVVVIPEKPPVDQNGILHTNAPRNRPYDWVLASKGLDACEVPVSLGGSEFAHGLVFDTRVFQPLGAVAPAQLEDSGVKNMQHMAVVRDFLLPVPEP